MKYNVIYNTVSGALHAWGQHAGVVIPAGFSCAEIDTEVDLDNQHQLYRINSGVLQQVPDVIDIQHQQLMLQVRQQRNNLLLTSDWTQMPDTALTSDQIHAWKQYRQALREITDQLPSVISIDYQVAWPEKPI